MSDYYVRIFADTSDYPILVIVSKLITLNTPL